MRVQRTDRTDAFTLPEVAIGMAIIAVLAGLTFSQLGQWQGRQQVRSAARGVADALQMARTDAMRTGNNHIIYFRVDGVNTTDPKGVNVADNGGNNVPILILDDGPPSTSNCSIDPGEGRRGFEYVQNVAWGATTAPFSAPQDNAAPTHASGITFSNPDNPANPITWLMFRPDGVPVAFSGSAISGCLTVGDTGSGSGAVYLTNGERDFAVVLSPLGGVRVHAWRDDTSQWN